MGLSLDLCMCCCPVEESAELFVKSHLISRKWKDFKAVQGRRNGASKLILAMESPHGFTSASPSGLSMTLIHYCLMLWAAKCPVKALLPTK